MPEISFTRGINGLTDGMESKARLVEADWCFLQRHKKLTHTINTKTNNQEESFSKVHNSFSFIY
jgi:hypothetical protein